MIRLLFLVFIILAAGFWLRRFLAADNPDPGPPRQARDSMVPCGYCQLYVPRTTAIHADDARYYCCRDHAGKAGRGERDP